MRSSRQGRAGAVFTRRARLLSRRMADRTAMKVPQGSAARSAARLARESSIELSCLESADIEAGRDFLPAGQKVYVSHLPRQTWERTAGTCARAAAAGFDPVPHVPVRLITSEQQLDEVLSA